MKMKQGTNNTYQEILHLSDKRQLYIAYSPIYKYELPKGHRFPMEKYELIPEQLLYEGTIREGQFFYPEAMEDKILLLTHSAAYLEKLSSVDLTRREQRDIGFPVLRSLITRGKHIAQGTLDCAMLSLEYGVAMNVAGGTHHAYADKGEGFCVFNDIALASNALLHSNKVSQILIVDLDVHQGNGTAKIFENENRVYTFSMHGERNYPLRKEKSDLDIGLFDGTGDKEYLEILYKTLPGLLATTNPDIVFYLSGVDVLATDKLGRISMTKEGCKERDRFVLQSMKDASIPTVVSMGGGYSEKIADIIEAHCNTFRLAQDIFF